MHHQKAGRLLSRKTSHRIAMYRTMVDSLMELEVMETTVPKAKELRKYADRVITLGKRGTLHARRRAMRLIRRREVMQKVFGELAEHFRQRPGGYTRVLHLGPRPSDSAPMAIIELVGRSRKAPMQKVAGAKGKQAQVNASDEGQEPAESKKSAKAKTSKKSDASKSKKTAAKKKSAKD